MKRIDNIREYLERGYILTISGVGPKYYGIITLRPLVTDCEEVEVNNIINQMPGIREQLETYRTICQVSYNYDTRKISGQIKKMYTEGPYCENCFYKVVSDYEVENDDIFTTLIELNDKVTKKNHQANQNKEKMKVKSGE